MDRRFDRGPLSELDPVTFFIVTELMVDEREPRLPITQVTEANEDLFRQVA
jgi:hypothetical protein